MTAVGRVRETGRPPARPRRAASASSAPLAPLASGDTVAGRDPDRRRAANDHPADGVSHLLPRLQAHLDRLGGEPRLVEKDDRTVLDAGDPVGRERG